MVAKREELLHGRALVTEHERVHSRQANHGNRSELAHNMTVLVTGGAGYIGSHMVHALFEARDQVVVLDNLITGFDWAVPPDATLIVGDVGDQSCVGALIAAHRIDAVIHFAASIA